MNNEKRNSFKSESSITTSQSLLFAIDFKAIVNTPEGRRFLWCLLAECGVYQGSFGVDALHMAYREGRRSIGLYVQTLFVDTPDQYLLMQKESFASDAYLAVQEARERQDVEQGEFNIADSNLYSSFDED